MSITISTSSWHMLRGFEPMSLCDWPGRISCVLFFGGCNLRCPTCHNYQLAWYPGEAEPVDGKKTLETINARKDWLDGVVLTGGEVTILSGLLDILADLRGMGLELKVDTNGMRPETVSTIMDRGLADVFAVDVKGPWEKYSRLTGGRVGPEEAEENLDRIFALAGHSPERFYFRCTKVPDLSERDLQRTAAYLPRGMELHFQEYVPVAVEEEENENAAQTAEIQEEPCPSR